MPEFPETAYSLGFLCYSNTLHVFEWGYTRDYEHYRASFRRKGEIYQITEIVAAEGLR